MFYTRFDVVSGGITVNKTVALEPTDEEIQEIEAEMDRMLLQMARIDERIKKDQEEIDRLTIKTRGILDQLQAQ
jgi:phosphoenolpyruvate synthase/pyruvate phosphate dikinase